MGPINLGPEWFWKTLFVLAFIGALVGIMYIVQAVIWLLNHVHIS